MNNEKQNSLRILIIQRRPAIIARRLFLSSYYKSTRMKNKTIFKTINRFRYESKSHFRII